MKMLLSIAAVVAAGSALVSTSAASASEAVNFTYDANGRIVRIQRTGSVNNNVVSNYNYDAADNRTHVTVSGVPTGILSSSSPTNSCTIGSNGVSEA